MTDDLTDVASRASEEWDYRYTESKFHQGQMPASIPCQLRFTGTSEWDTDRFHEALDVHGYSPLNTRPGDHPPTYKGEVCSQEHYNRVSVLVFRADTVRLYPLDDYIPSVDELAELLHALSVGAKAGLEHDPIDGDNK
jgi:hypothetical protein